MAGRTGALRTGGRPATRLVFYATESGGQTLDADEEGGNPFATALIEIAADDELRLRDLPDRLRERTYANSRGLQRVEATGHIARPEWRLSAGAAGSSEPRVALVLVVSDYEGMDSLAGAARDELRISGLFAEKGFAVVDGVRPGRTDLAAALDAFASQSSDSDLAVLYSTGHGIEDQGAVYLLPGDYPFDRGFETSTLRKHAVSVDQMVDASRGKEQNLIFFAGCRTSLVEGAAGVR